MGPVRARELHQVTLSRLVGRQSLLNCWCTLYVSVKCSIRVVIVWLSLDSHSQAESGQIASIQASSLIANPTLAGNATK